MKAVTALIVLSLDRATFVDVLGPLQDIMTKEKSPDVSVVGAEAVLGVVGWWVVGGRECVGAEAALGVVGWWLVVGWWT